jgi:hypothetical protein
LDNAPLQADQVATLLQLLAAPEIADLLFRIDQRLPAQTPVLRDALLKSAASAVANGDVPVALARIQELITQNPQQAETIAADPSFDTIRPSVSALVRALAADVQTRSAQSLEAAAQAIAAGGVKKLPGSDIDTSALLALATRFSESGRIADFSRAVELAQFIVAQYAPAPANVARSRKPVAAPARAAWSTAAARDRLSRLWRRAPLLVLLLAWLAIGLVGGVCVVVLRKVQPDALDPSTVALGFSVWAIGFLGLVGFGFYMRVRNVRF